MSYWTAKIAREANYSEFWLAMHVQRACNAKKWAKRGDREFARYWGEAAREALANWYESREKVIDLENVA